MSKSRIFSVTTQVGIVIRTSKTKVYTYAIVTERGGVSAWCSRYDLALKAAKGTTWAHGGEIVEVVELEKEPADANPGIKIFSIANTFVNGTELWSTTLIQDLDGQQYVKWNDEFYPLPEGTKIGAEEKGYLDRIYTIYRFKCWKAEQDAAKAAEANKGSKAGDAKIQKLHEIEYGSIKPEAGVSWHKHKAQWEVKPCISGKRYFAGYYKKENLDAANQAAVAVKAAGSEKAQEVADCWKIIRKDQAL